MKLLLPLAVAQCIMWEVLALILSAYLDNNIFLWLILVGFVFYIALWITNVILASKNWRDI
jgi:hypothetical protein